MECVQVCYTIFFVLVVLPIEKIIADSEYMVSKPDSMTVPIGFETQLPCEMNIEPDKFQWKFYRSKEPYNPKAVINLSTSKYELVSNESYTKQKKRSPLTLKVKDTSMAGDYQCLAYYGAYVVASVPWRITITTLEKFPPQRNAEVSVTRGNTVYWRCEPPQSNPEAYIDYYKGDTHVEPIPAEPETRTLIKPNVSVEDSGVYKCKASNTMQEVDSPTYLNLRVLRNGPPQAPYFIIEPKKVYSALNGSSVFLECAAIGNPVPKVTWFKKNGSLPSNRIEMVSGGLKIKNIHPSDDGIYVCNHTNNHGTISHQITLNYNEEPNVICPYNNTDVKQGEDLEIECTVTGVPKPQISWFLNGFSLNNDNEIKINGDKISFKPVGKKHAGNLQCFARNPVSTVYDSVSMRVIPLPASIDDSYTPTHTHHRHGGKGNGTKKPQKHPKPPKMIPPSKPNISRLNDESVVVSWNVPSNNGLPIKFFKVQYRELGPANEHIRGSKASRWKTANPDIPPNIMVYDVNNLKTNYIYRFRIAAVYSNDDNKLSQNSDKFHLKSLDFFDRNLMPTPLITRTETVNSSSVRIYWEYTPSPNVTIDGFYISYISSSNAGDYMKATVIGENETSYVITHLQPDTHYDVKLQSFNSQGPSEFSPIMKAKTGPAPIVHNSSTGQPKVPPVKEEDLEDSKIYIIISVVVGLLALGIFVIAVFFVRRKGQRNNNTGDRDKPGVEVEHHIQADGNEYVVTPKPAKTNGCALPNRMTITSNPLAETDNKNQNMIEMSCLTTQNNNCSSATQPSASHHQESPSSTSPSNSKQKNKFKNRDKNNKHNNKHLVDLPGENYV